MTAGIVTRYAGPAISINVHTAVSIHPIGPIIIDAILVNPAFAARDNPLPTRNFITALTTETKRM